MSKLYAERDIIKQGNNYSRHTSAMTSEGLHSKSDIAAELAHRDIEIERLQAQVAELEGKLNLIHERFHELEQGGGTLQPLRECFDADKNEGSKTQ